MRISKLLLAAAAVTAITGPAYAAAGDILIRMRAVGVIPQVLDNINHTVAIDGNVIPEIDGTYFFTDNIAAELIAGVTKHEVKLGNVPLTSTWLLPPTLTVQYHLNPEGSIRPYVGAGINYTIFFGNEKQVLPINYVNNVGWALQAGVDIPTGVNGLFFNVDVKKIFLSTDVKAAGHKIGSARIDPWLIGFGVGLKL